MNLYKTGDLNKIIPKIALLFMHLIGHSMALIVFWGNEVARGVNVAELLAIQ
jgi:hypothetical protein